jgi:hypothetical protein
MDYSRLFAETEFDNANIVEGALQRFHLVDVSAASVCIHRVLRSSLR